MVYLYLIVIVAILAKIELIHHQHFVMKYHTLLVFVLLFACESNPKEEAKKPKKKVSIEEVDQGIRANIDAKTKEGNGYFTFTADTAELSLKLVRVHTEYLSVLGPNEYFACVDLATENGDVYDVDFFLTGEPGDMTVTRTSLHKLNGKPFYTWKQAVDKTWRTVPVKQATNELLGVIEGKDEFIFNYDAVIPKLSTNSRIWIPVAQTDRFQKVEVLNVITPVKHDILLEEKNGNSVLFLDLEPEHSGEKITIQYKVIRTEKSAYQEQDTEPQKYLESTAMIPVGDRFGIIAETVIQDKKAETPLTKARALYDYIIDNMRYAKEGTYGTGDANYACDSKSGNCTEFHSFFISLARSAGIPARFAVGASIPSERDEGGIEGYHCWAEFYAEGQWWPVDISEGNKYTPLATYYFGHHPANRIELSRGRNISPDPSPASGPINFLAYPVLEINGEPEFVKTTFSFERINSESGS